MRENEKLSDRAETCWLCHTISKLRLCQLPTWWYTVVHRLQHFWAPGTATQAGASTTTDTKTLLHVASNTQVGGVLPQAYNCPSPLRLWEVFQFLWHQVLKKLAPGPTNLRHQVLKKLAPCPCPFPPYPRDPVSIPKAPGSEKVSTMPRPTWLKAPGSEKVSTMPMPPLPMRSWIAVTT